MGHNILTIEETRLRGADSNSLLRLYDLAKAIVSKSHSQRERARADGALRRIAKELQKRNVPL
jgi:hypothetical protein